MQSILADTREAWLLLGVAAINRRIMRPRGHELPMDDINVTCGNPPGARGGKKTVVTICRPEMSSAGKWEIFVSPLQADPRVILPALARALVKVLDLTPQDARDFAEATMAEVDAITAPDDLGPYLHKAMKESERKRQTTRMIKCECEDCGYSGRFTRKWLDVALPNCPDKNCNLYGISMTPQLEPKDD